MGKRKRRLGGNFMNFTFNNKKYELLDANKEILDYIAFNNKDSYFPTDHWEINIFILYGVMQSGKSEFTKYVCDLGDKIYTKTKGGFECYKTNDLTYSLNKLNENIDKRKKTLFLIFDDAIGDEAVGMNSLKTGSSDSVDMESVLTMVRHKLADEDKFGKPNPKCRNGYCCLMYCVQHPRRLSTLIRENHTIQIYKTAYNEIKKEFDEEDYEYLEDITEDSNKHIYNARSSALAKTKGNRVLKIHFDRVKYKIPFLIEEKKDSKNDNLIEKLLEFDLDKINNEILKGFIEDYAEKNDVKIKSHAIGRIIRKSKLIQFKGVFEEEKKNNNDKLDLELIARIREKTGASILSLTDFYDKSQAQLYRDLDNLQAQKKKSKLNHENNKKIN